MRLGEQRSEVTSPRSQKFSDSQPDLGPVCSSLRWGHGQMCREGEGQLAPVRSGTDPTATSLRRSMGSAPRRTSAGLRGGGSGGPADLDSPLGPPCGQRAGHVPFPGRGRGSPARAGRRRGSCAARDGAGTREGLARLGWRGGLPGLGKGLEQKCFLFQRLPAWPGSTTPS